MRPRRAHRQDGNHAEIVGAFDRAGCSVLSLHSIGSGCPDLCVGYGGLVVLVEVKDSAKPPSKRNLTPDEEKFRMNWKGGYKVVQDQAGVDETVALLQDWAGRLK